MTNPHGEVTAASRARRVFVVGTWLLTLVGSVALIVFVAQGAGAALAGLDSNVSWIALFGVVAALFTSMGAAIEARSPGNRVGLLMVICGPLLLLTFGGFLLAGARGAAYGPDDLLGGLAAWVATISIGPTLFVVGPLLATVFPDGRLPGVRWRGPVVAVGAIIAVADLLTAFQPGPPQSNLPNNPFGIAGVDWLVALRPIGEGLFLPGFLGGVALAVIAVTARFRRSSGHEREQMKWFLAAFIAIGLTAPLGTFDGSTTTTVFDLGLILSIGLVPVSVGIAVTRYRLYDIDTIINRALVYGLLTAILAGVSTAAISLAQRLSVGLLGQGSDTVIVLTTLLAVAAFNPLKVRLQALVDRRFKEARDPASILVAMAAQLEAAPWRADPDRTVRWLLDAAIVAFQGTGGRVRVTDGDGHAWTSATATSGTGSEVFVEAAAPPAHLDLRIDGLRVDLPLGDQDRRTIVDSLTRVLQEVVPGAGPAIAPQGEPETVVNAADEHVRGEVVATIAP
ncbi:MAG: hypothetical protein ACAH65_06595 [Chloroflexota bacterium]